MSANRYLQHLQNTSPAKTTYSFSKVQRFYDYNKSQTPNKFYESPNVKSQRATSFGFGKKSDMVNKASGDPGSIKTLGQFQLIKIKSKHSISSTFGESHESIYKRRLNQNKTPGPGVYHPQNFKNKIKFYMAPKIKYPEISNLKIGPQTYQIQKCLQKVSKYKASKSFRIKTQISKSKLDFYLNSPGPGAYNPQKLYALEQQMLSKSITGAASFSRQKRLKTQSQNKIGPGSYQTFSVFGQSQIKKD